MARGNGGLDQGCSREKWGGGWRCLIVISLKTEYSEHRFWWGGGKGGNIASRQVVAQMYWILIIFQIHYESRNKRIGEELNGGGASDKERRKMTGMKMSSSEVGQIVGGFSFPLLRLKMLIIICQFLYTVFAFRNLECMEYSQSREWVWFGMATCLYLKVKTITSCADLRNVSWMFWLIRVHYL